MKLKTKNYKLLKAKKEFKNTDIFFIFNGTISKKFLKTDQKIKELNFEFHKIHNALALKTLNTSIYKNFKYVISGLLFLIKPNIKNFYIQFKKLSKLENSLKLIALKINNNIFNISKLNFKLKFDYKSNTLLLFQIFRIYFKKNLIINIK